MFTNIFNKIESIYSISNEISEGWSSLTIKGKYEACNTNMFKDLENEFSLLNLNRSLNLKIDNNIYIADDFIENLISGCVWEIHINKTLLITTLKEKEGNYFNFFFLKKNLVKWIENSNPFSEEHPFNKFKEIKIIVKDIDISFGGLNFIISNNRKTEFNKNIELPDELEILNHVHIFSKSKIRINPISHIVTFGELNEISKYFYRNSISILLSCLCNEIYDDDKIVLRGIRRIPLQLGSNFNIEINKPYNDLLIKILIWIHSENNKSDLKLKLLLERITLDLNLNVPFSIGLQPILEDSFEQAKERYTFIVYDRKDLYQKELKELLKDLKNISELYAQKVRSLLGNLLRDILAAFFLIGITMFSKSESINQLFNNNLISYVFKAFSIYFIISIVLQFIIDYFDTIKSEYEFDYWQGVSKEYMSKEDFERHKSNTLGKRKSVSKILYLIIVILYLVIAFLSWNFPCLWSQLFN